MTEKNLNEVLPARRVLYENGCALTSQGKVADAIILFNDILDDEPGFVACREALRKAQLKCAEHKVGFRKHLIEELRIFFLLAEAEIYLHSQPLNAIHVAEEVLNRAPLDILAHKILAQAALEVKMPRTALLSLRLLPWQVSEHVSTSLELADALAQTGQISEAVSICGRLLKEHPGDNRVTRALTRFYKIGRERRTSALPISRNFKSGIDSKQVFGARTILSPAELQTAISKFEVLQQHGPKNLKVLKTLGNLYEQKSDFDRALEYYWRALDIVGNRTDHELENAIAGIAKKRAVEFKA